MTNNLRIRAYEHQAWHNVLRGCWEIVVQGGGMPTPLAFDVFDFEIQHLPGTYEDRQAFLGQRISEEIVKHTKGTLIARDRHEARNFG